MPELSRFFGIIVSMNYNEHAPPHFHIRYGQFKAMMRIKDLSLMEGNFPPRAMGLVVEWALLHRDELQKSWELAEARAELPKIQPLE